MDEPQVKDEKKTEVASSAASNRGQKYKDAAKALKQRKRRAHRRRLRASSASG